MGDDITIGVTEIVNNIEVTAQPNDQIVDISVIDNTDEVTLNITPTVIEINVNKGSSYAKWGTILGVLEDQTDLKDALDLKANLVDGKVPASELPSYVDDVVEVANYAALPTTGETGKIYVTLDNNKIYRWSGSVYIEIAANNAIWGAITGTLSNQTDLQTALNTKALKTITITPNAPLSGGGDLSANRTISISQSNTTTDGYLSSTDWNTFNSKQSALGYTAANDANVVHKTGNESIAGIKTFTDNIVSNTFYSSKIISGGYMPSAGYSNMYSNDLMLTFNQMNAAGTAVTTFNLIYPTSNTLRTYNLPNSDGTLALTSQLHNAVTIGTANGLSLSTQVLSLGLASGSTNGALSSTDWSTFNSKLSGPTLNANFLTKTLYTGTPQLVNSSIYDNGNVGIGTSSPAYRLDVLRNGAGIQDVLSIDNLNQTVGVLDGVRLNLRGFNIEASSTYGSADNKFTIGFTTSKDITLLQNGNVGIGTTSPFRKLHVVGDFAVNASSSQYYGVNIGGGEGSNPYILIGDWHNASANLTWDSAGRFLRIDSQYSTSGAPIVFSGNDGASEYMRITGLGNVGIGTTSPSYTLHVNGSVAGTSAYNNLSDKRYKKDILPIENALDKILALNGVTFNWDKEATDMNLDDNNHIGLLAQDVEEIIPQAVTTGTDENETKSVAYTDLVPVLIEAIKELQQQINILKNK